MALRLGALHDALLDAGAEASLAKKAAEELANYEQQLTAIRTDLAVVKWMLGFVIGMLFALLWKVFS